MFLLTLLALPSCKAQNVQYAHLKVNLYSQIDLKVPNELSTPDFLVNNYAFYPKSKTIGYAKSYVSPMSSSGIGRLYYEEIKKADYNSFEILNADLNFAKDKNTYYLNGEDLNIQPINNAKITFDEFHNIRIVAEDSTLVLRTGISKLDKYFGYQPVGDITYYKNDSAFIFKDGNMTYIKNQNFDAVTLKHIDWHLYQDKQNIYFIDNNNNVDKIENEQIINRHTFNTRRYDDKMDAQNFVTIYRGQKGIYVNNGKRSNYKLQDFFEVPNSNYFVYNKNLYFEDGFDFNPIGTSVSKVVNINKFEPDLNDPLALQIENHNFKVLAFDVIIYDNDKLFKGNQFISYDAGINLTDLQYLGKMPDEIQNLIKCDYKTTSCEKDLLLSNGEYYHIMGGALKKVKNGKTIFKSLKLLNDYYYIYKYKLLGDRSFRVYKNSPDKQITDRTINFRDIKVFGKYFSTGKDLWYEAIKTKDNANEISIQQAFSGLKTISLPIKTKTLNQEISKINFGNLIEVHKTEYITDGVYIVFRGNVIGKIDFKSLKVLGKNYLEDKNQYFFESYSITKEKLK